MKTLLIINQSQFGYHSDTYYYCKYLRQKYRIAYLCWDYGKKRITLDGVRVIYLSREGSKPARNIRFLLGAIREIRKSYHIHMIKYFRGCTLLRLIYPRYPFLLDIRTDTVGRQPVNWLSYTLGSRIEPAFFTHVSVISKGLSSNLGLSQKAFILPLGADILSDTDKDFRTMHLLYVGTFQSRNLHLALEGYNRFYRSFARKINLKFTIVGSGSTAEEDRLIKMADRGDAGESVVITGYVPHDELPPFFDSHNIGVSFVPRTRVFDHQPPTKTFEYLLSGMPVIATATSENRDVITRKNGILIDDSADGFYDGLVRMFNRLPTYDSHVIRRNALPHTWEKIVSNLAERLDEIDRTNLKKRHYG